MNITMTKDRKLRLKAKEACKNSYSPYSKFKVGASVLAASGKMYSGTNVENASYGLTICAERVAIFSAIAAGETSIIALCLYTPTSTPTQPCGACLQVMSEFGSKEEVVLDLDTIIEIGDANDVYLIGICKNKKEYSGFLSEMYNDKFTNEKFTF